MRRKKGNSTDELEKKNETNYNNFILDSDPMPCKKIKQST